MRRKRAMAIILGVASMISAEVLGQRIELKNITKRAYTNQTFRLPVTVPDGDIKVLVDGKEIPSVVDIVAGKRVIYVRTGMASGARHRFEVQAGKPGTFESGVKVSEEKDAIVLDNGLFAVRLPRATEGGKPPGPVSAVRLGGKWVGSGHWRTDMPFQALKIKVVDPGKVMGKVRLRYECKGKAGINGDKDAHAEIDVSLMPGLPFAVLEERHAMSRASEWRFNVTDGWKATNSILRPHFGGIGGIKRDASRAGTLLPNQVPFQDPKLLLNLFPRWNQHCKDGWLCAARGEDGAVGAVTILAGHWYWPHDSSIRCRVKDSGDSLTLHCPTRRGRRYWWLMAGEPERFEKAQALATEHGYESLDTIFNDIQVRDWEGVKGAYRGYWPLQGNINPTSIVRSLGRRSLKSAGKLVNSLSHLTHAQVLLSPHTYGSYWLYWSPENPNFFTDLNKWPIGMICNLREHPRFKELAQMAVGKLREDIYHSITLPSGAGNECPGYQAYAMKHYAEMAPVFKKHLGVDPMTWPRMKAGARFLIRLSQPNGAGNRGCHPGGDTHDTFTDPRKWMAPFGVNEDVSSFKTEELQGFGVVFRNRCGTAKETYLAFKSGPSRGHFHGDQLSFHYCANAERVAVDHRCSYSPRAGQEHMHNRVAFHTEKMPYANMDGYERIVAFKTSPLADVAIGQVESWRLRAAKKLPAENWDQRYPTMPFEGRPLVYRRTVVQLKTGEPDVFVIRDQSRSPVELNATWCLHVLGETCEQKGPAFIFDKLNVYVAQPKAFKVSRLDWEHGKGNKHEATKGLRLTVTGSKHEFITVIYPRSGKAPEVAPIKGGVRVNDAEVVFGGQAIDDADGTTYVEVKRVDESLLRLTGKDIDYDRNQGEIGLFVPDAGYPFGEIPDWLARQRSKVPEWAPDWAKEIRDQE